MQAALPWQLPVLLCLSGNLYATTFLVNDFLNHHTRFSVQTTYCFNRNIETHHAKREWAVLDKCWENKTIKQHSVQAMFF